MARFFARTASLVALSLLPALLSCADEERASPSASPAPAPTPSAPRARAATVALYQTAPTRLLTPFPSDRFTVTDPSRPTGRRPALPTTDDPLLALGSSLPAQLAETDGFSPIGGVALAFSGALADLAALSPDALSAPSSPLFLLDADAASPTRGQAIPLVLRSYATFADDGPRDDFVLIAQPASPLRPRASYLFVATDRLRDAQGRPVGPSEDTDALILGSAEGDYGNRLRAALPLFTQASGLGVEHVALATLFSTGSVIDETFAMGQALRASPPPALDGKIEVIEVSQGDGRVRLRGRYFAPEFRRPAPDGRWQIAQGAPVKQADVSLEFLLSFSDRTHSGPRPVVIYGHGLGGDKGGAWGTAGRLADVDVAVIGIDAPEHGSRAAPGAQASDTIFDFFALDATTGGFDLQRARDNFRQMGADHLQLVRLLAGPLATLDVLPLDAPDGVPDLDPSRLFYLGHSFGSVLASTSLALAPEIQAGCLNVGGAGILTILRESDTFNLLVKGLRPKTLTEGDMARFFAAAQAIVDPGDPLNYAPYVSRGAGPGVESWRPRSLLLQEVFEDRIVPNLSTQLLARALGLAQARPRVSEIGAIPQLPAPLAGNLAATATGAYVQFDRADGKTAEHGELIFTAEARAQYVRFFQDAAAGLPPTVIDPFDPAP